MDKGFELIKAKKQQCFNIVVFIFVFGIITHLLIISNLLYNHDSAFTVTNSYNWLITQGKYFVTPIHSFEGRYDLNAFLMLIGMFFISASSVIFCLTIKNQNKWIIQLICIMFVTFPSVTTFGLYHCIDYFEI